MVIYIVKKYIKIIKEITKLIAVLAWGLITALKKTLCNQLLFPVLKILLSQSSFFVRGKKSL